MDRYDIVQDCPFGDYYIDTVSKGDYVKYDNIPKWISVKDRLPDNISYIAIINDSGYITGCEPIQLKDLDKAFKTLRITHWMPLSDLEKLPVEGE